MFARKVKAMSKGAAAFTTGVLLSVSAHAAPVYNGAAELVGFTGLSVAGGTYNVQFVDGTFNSVFPGGALFDEPTAAAAATALYSSFTPQNAAGVAIAPYNIFGCGDAPIRTGVQACELMTPDTMAVGAGFVDVVSMRHGDQAIGGVLQDGNSAFTFSTTTNTTGFIALASAYTWALWTPAGGSVPEPATMGLVAMAVGLMLATARPRLRRDAAHRVGHQGAG